MTTDTPTITRPGQSRESILVYGRESSGKSWQVFNIARATHNNHFYVIDNDDAPSYNLGLETAYVDLADRFTVAEIDRSDWPTHIATITDWHARAGDNDWLVVDSATPMYAMVQEWYTGQVFDNNIADFFLEQRLKLEKSKDGKKLETFEGWKDWPVIKAQYREYNKLVRTWPGHVYQTCEAKGLGDFDDKTVKKLYGPLGAKPDGEGKIGHTTRTVLLFEKGGRGEWVMTTVKDRYRDELVDEPLRDFALDYLRDVGGWREVAAVPAVDPYAGMTRAEKLAAMRGAE